jgi:hypothetical protein
LKYGHGVGRQRLPVELNAKRNKKGIGTDLTVKNDFNEETCAAAQAKCSGLFELVFPQLQKSRKRLTGLLMCLMFIKVAFSWDLKENWKTFQKQIKVRSPNVSLIGVLKWIACYLKR